MKNQHAVPSLICRARSCAPWVLGLALCVRAPTAEAQERPWSTQRTLEYQADDGGRATDPQDPDLVRAGVHPTLDEALARAVTTERHSAADLDGDGRIDLLLVVTPRRDPYPFNRAPGLVLARAVAGGWSATVVARRWQPEREANDSSDRYAWMPPVVGRQGALLVIDDQNNVSHDPHDYYEHAVSFVRVDRAGRLWQVGGAGWTDGAASELPCRASRFRFVGAWSVRGDARECRPLRLEPRR